MYMVNKDSGCKRWSFNVLYYYENNTIWFIIDEKPNGGKSHANLQQTNPKQNSTNNKIQRKNTHNKNPTPR